MKFTIKLLAILTLAIQGLLISAASQSPADFVVQVFKTADAQAQDIRTKERQNPIELKKKIADIYGAAIAIVIEKASTDAANANQLLTLLDPELQKHFNVQATANGTPAQQDQAQELVGQSFDTFSSIPNNYAPVVADVINLAKNQFGTNETVRAIILNTFKTYIRTLVNERLKIDDIFSKQSIADATHQILTQELKDKTAVQSRMIVNILMDKLIKQTNAKMSQTAAQNDGKKITEDVTSWFKNYNNGQGATSLPDMSALIQKILHDNYPPEKLFLILTTVRNLLLFAVTPTPIQLPQAGEWDAPHHCKWYDVSCQVPWDAVGGAFKKVFADWIGGGLKVAFVDNVYEKGLKKIGDLVTSGIDKVRDVAHTIRDAVRAAADKISDTPNIIAKKAVDIIGADPVTQVTRQTQGLAPLPDLAAKLQAGSDKLNTQIKTILATIETIKKQKEAVVKQNLNRKGLKELKELNTILLGDANNPGAFDDVVAALHELASPDCKTGALCEIQAAFRAASLKAQTDEKTIKSKIQELDRQINHPTLEKDGVLESLPNRLRNLAKLLDI